MANSHTKSRGTEDYGYAVSGNKASQVEVIEANELKARLAGNEAVDDDAAARNACDNAEEVAPVKKKPKVKRPKPTGFEDYYADAPLTPAEHTEEQELYDRYLT
jgi:hypothetical protein